MTSRYIEGTAGQESDLKVGFRHTGDTTAEERAAIEGLAMASLWLTCTYGGIGARARRGFGGVRIVGATGGCSGDELPLAEPWTKPSAPAGVSGGDPFMDWKKVLIHAGQQWRHFRAAEFNASQDARYDPRIETPEWIKTVHGTDSRFPLGALGLPVVYKDRYLVNADGAGHGDPQRRRASPLWLRAVGDGDEFRLLSHAFQGEFLPGQVRLWRGNSQVKPVQVTNDDVKRQTDQWIKVLGDDDTFVRDPGEPAQGHRRLTGGVGR
jgi:CRISPR-associated protein Cmr1